MCLIICYFFEVVKQKLLLKKKSYLLFGVSDTVCEVMTVLKTNTLFPSRFVLMSMELITCHVTNRLAFLAGTYFLGFFFLGCH